MGVEAFSLQMRDHFRISACSVRSRIDCCLIGCRHDCRRQCKIWAGRCRKCKKQEMEMNHLIAERRCSKRSRVRKKEGCIWCETGRFCHWTSCEKSTRAEGHACHWDTSLAGCWLSYWEERGWSHLQSTQGSEFRQIDFTCVTATFWYCLWGLSL